MHTWLGVASVVLVDWVEVVDQTILLVGVMHLVAVLLVAMPTLETFLPKAIVQHMREVEVEVVDDDVVVAWQQLQVLLPQQLWFADDVE